MGMDEKQNRRSANCHSQGIAEEMSAKSDKIRLIFFCILIFG